MRLRQKVDVQREIIKFVKSREGKSGIIYCLSRKESRRTCSSITSKWNKGPSLSCWP